MQHQGGPPGIVDDVQNTLAPGEPGEIHRGRAGMGEHPHRGGVYEHLRVGMAVQVVIVVRAVREAPPVPRITTFFPFREIPARWAM